MENVILGPTCLTNLEDHTLLNFSDKLETILFGEEVPITQIWQTQERVYDDDEVAALIRCEQWKKRISVIQNTMASPITPIL